MNIIKVSEKGQIAIPQSIREQLGIVQGDELILFNLNGKLLLEKAQTTEKKIKDSFKDILYFSEQSLRDVWDNKDDEVWNEYLK